MLLGAAVPCIPDSGRRMLRDCARAGGGDPLGLVPWVGSTSTPWCLLASLPSLPSCLPSAGSTAEGGVLPAASRGRLSTRKDAPSRFFFFSGKEPRPAACSFPPWQTDPYSGLVPTPLNGSSSRPIALGDSACQSTSRLQGHSDPLLPQVDGGYQPHSVRWPLAHRLLWWRCPQHCAFGLS